MRAVLHTRYGHLIEIRLVLLLAVLPLLLVVRKSWHPESWWWALAVPLGVAIAATPGLAGHAATGTFTQFAVPLDTLHVAAMSIWLGGLASLALIVIDRDPDAGRVGRPLLAGRAVERAGDRRDPACSPRGARSAGRSMRSAHTTYGRILLSKIMVFIGLLLLAAWSRQIVHARRPATLSAAVATEPQTDLERAPRPSDPSVRGLRWSVGGELVFGIAILLITSMLVNSQPARSALSLPYSKEFHEPTMLINLIVSPAKAGPVDIHVYTLSPAGGNLFTPSVTADDEPAVEGHRADHRSRSCGPGPNHFLACQSAAVDRDRHRNLPRQVQHSVRRQVARRDPRAAQRVRRGRGTDDRRHQIAVEQRGDRAVS